MQTVKLIIILLIISFLSACHSYTITDKKQLETKTTSVSSENGQAEDNSEYIKIVRNSDYFISMEGRGVEMKYDDWTNYDYDDYEDERFLINGKQYTTGLGADGKTIDGYDNRNYSQDSYHIVKGQYDKITGIFGFDDRTPIISDADLVIFQDGTETFRTTINTENLFKEIEANISPETKDLIIKFEITGNINDRIPMIIFADIKARLVQ